MVFPSARDFEKTYLTRALKQPLPANPHYQKRFDELHKLAAAGNSAAVRDYKISGSNSYSKLIARYQQDLLALHAASGDAQ
jgi:hypothetical protein